MAKNTVYTHLKNEFPGYNIVAGVDEVGSGYMRKFYYKLVYLLYNLGFTSLKKNIDNKELDDLVNSIIFTNIKNYIYNYIRCDLNNDSKIEFIINVHSNKKYKDYESTFKDLNILYNYYRLVKDIELKYGISLKRYSFDKIWKLSLFDFIGLVYKEVIKK